MPEKILMPPDHRILKIQIADWRLTVDQLQTLQLASLQILAMDQVQFLQLDLQQNMMMEQSKDAELDRKSVV